MLKRIFDIFFSLTALFVLFPFFILISIFVLFDSKGEIFYRQTRVGKNNKDFTLYKFRTMKKNSEQQGLITIGEKDNRITNAGYYLRKYKLDELPQFLNVLLGYMSVVGPRPEVRKYVDMYSEEQKKVLSIRPGITDYASLQYSNENKMLGKVSDPEEVYVNEIMPAKLKLNLQYIKERNYFIDLKIIVRTILKIWQ